MVTLSTAFSSSRYSSFIACRLACFSDVNDFVEPDLLVAKKTPDLFLTTFPLVVE